MNYFCYLNKHDYADKVFCNGKHYSNQGTYYVKCNNCEDKKYLPTNRCMKCGCNILESSTNLKCDLCQ